MTTSHLEQLRDLFIEASSGLRDVQRKKMFGCDGFFRDASVFGLIWKKGRIGVRLPDPAAYDKLMAVDGADPWTAGNRKMSHWVLVPESFHARPAELKRWVVEAHRLALAPKSPKSATKQPAPVSRKKPAKR